MCCRARSATANCATPRSPPWRCRKCSATGCKAGASPSASSAARRSIASPTSTPRWSAPTTSRKRGFPAAAAHPRSPAPAAKFHHHAPVAAQLRREARLRHLVRPRRRRRPSCAHGTRDQGSDQARHRSRHLRARPGDQGDDGHLDPSGGDARGDQGQYRLARALRRRCGRDACADRAGIVSVAGVARAHRARSRRGGVSERRGTSCMTDMRDVFLCDAARTPIGRYGGVLAKGRADDLAAVPIRALLKRHPKADWSALDEVVFGCANQAGEDNRNVARMALLLAGLPDSIPGITVNRLCASGLNAIGDAARAIRCGETEFAIAGGVESMTRAALVMGKAQEAFPRGAEIHDTTLGWRFVNPVIKAQYGIDSMAETGENVAEEYQVSRADQDAFALRSQQRA